MHGLRYDPGFFTRVAGEARLVLDDLLTVPDIVERQHLIVERRDQVGELPHLAAVARRENQFHRRAFSSAARCAK